MFMQAKEVRKFLAQRGFDMKGVKVRFMQNPFGGEGKFFVETPKDDGQVYMTVAAPGEPTRYSDELRTKMAEALRGTNARVQ